MKIIFFGLGSIGQRHARILLKRKGYELFAFRTGLSDAPPVDFPIGNLTSWDEIDALKPDIAFITNPTALHIPTAIACAKRGMALFIEKPLGSSTEDLDELLSVVKHKKVSSYVAYLLRFSPVILKIKELIDAERFLHMQIEAGSFFPSWRPGRDHFKSYSASKELGGGILLDLSHELDYVHFLLGGIEHIEGQCGRKSNVTVDSDDYADMLVSAVKGTANIHLSYFSHMNQRSIKVDLVGQTIMADLLTGTVQCYKNKTLAQEFHFESSADLLMEKQMDYFFDHVHQGRMMNDVFEAQELFRKICDFREKAYA